MGIKGLNNFLHKKGEIHEVNISDKVNEWKK